jgi:hypothetical protein
MCADPEMPVPARPAPGGRIRFTGSCCDIESQVLVDGWPPVGGESFEVGCEHCPAVCRVQVRTAMFA